ncbi:integrase core domain-containing protein [Ruegeria sp. HKCCD8929]|uniref:integrase core domain-containing protein n=1 Tax=Ruegeria sp. HKCCD8929 TaxID=2683006 RepID=UPI001487D40B|nr:integrase core domain-containing protein [Ruegeria sp. HKCCD8929]
MLILTGLGHDLRTPLTRFKLGLSVNEDTPENRGCSATPARPTREPATWLEDQKMVHIRRAPNHPQTQGKIECWHQTFHNGVLLENYYLPGAREQAIGDFIDHYNHHHCNESIGNRTPADVYFGPSDDAPKEKKTTKKSTLKQRRMLNLGRAA